MNTTNKTFFNRFAPQYTKPKEAVKLRVRGKFSSFRYHDAESGFSVMNVKLTDIRVLLGADAKHSLPKLGHSIAIVGSIPYPRLGRDVEVEAVGLWDQGKFGFQLTSETFSIPDPQDEKGLIAYLSSGLLKWIGPVRAKQMVKSFGVDALRILDEDPGRIVEVQGLGGKLTAKVVAHWQEQRRASVLIEALCRLQLPVSFARRALKVFGETAAEQIKENPFILIRLNGISFKKADNVARTIGMAPESPERIKAGLVFALQTAAGAEGHCYLPEAELVKRAAGQNILNLDASKVIDVLRHGWAASLFETSKDGKGPLSVLNGMAIYFDGKYYLDDIYKSERYVAARIKELAAGSKHRKICPELAATVAKEHQRCAFLTDEQREALLTSVASKLSVVTGLPGVGKTTTMKAVLAVLDAMGASYSLAAPTGKAAKRLSTSTGAEAKTVHRLLEVSGRSGFLRNEQNPLRVDFVILDEASMLDIKLAESLLRAIQGETCLMLVGDPNQLPSVGPGNILRDILKNGLCRFKTLTKIQRQAETSKIITLAHDIHRGKKYKDLTFGGDCRFIEVETPVQARDLIVELVECGAEKFLPHEVQVLSPMRKGETGTFALNSLLQKALAPHNDSLVASMGYSVPLLGKSELDTAKGFCDFKLGDKVIQTVNNYDKEVFNGEIGHVVSINTEDDEVVVLFDDNRALTYDSDELTQLQLAYALTIHKAQGSEFKAVVIPILTEHYMMLFRNEIYTGVTRATENLFLVGTKKAMEMAVSNNKPLNRYTDLLSW